jgi:hydrogenase nickel incorporation protein HypA/HybF
MHELAITKSIIDLVETEAKKQGFKKALEIRLRLGEYSGIVPAYIEDFFPLVAEGKVSEGAKLFFETLSANYPNAKIFALAPIWRGNYNTKVTPIGEFSNVVKHFDKVVSALPNVTLIDCFDFIPHHADFFVEDLLHPNDAGFAHYAAELYKAIKSYI